MRPWTAVAGATLALAVAASANAAVIVSQASFGTTALGETSLFLPKYAGSGTITNVELSFRGESNQYFDVFGGDDPIILPELPASWIIGLAGPVGDEMTFGEFVVNAVYPEFEVPAGPGDEHTRFTDFVAVAIDGADSRFGLYQGTGDNAFVVYGFGDVFIQGRGTLTQTITIAEPIPEPATWTMLLLGFGGAGAWLRRRRALVA
jgi:hypothetical protein